jgi:ribosomal protein L11 methyltransferase
MEISRRMYFGGTRAVWPKTTTRAGTCWPKRSSAFGKTRVVSDAAAPILPRWEYAIPGPLRERLNGLTLAGAKTTTFGLQVFDDIDFENGESLPFVSQRWTMVGTNGAELAILEVVGHEHMRLADVSWELANAEGESFVSVADWRTAHEAFWQPFLAEIRTFTGDPDWVVSDDTVTTCTHIRVEKTLPGANMARFPVVECVVGSSDVEFASTDLLDLDTTGIEEIDGGPGVTTTNGSAVPNGSVLLRAGFGSDEAAVAAEAALNQIHREWLPRFEVLLGDEWLDAWREHFEPQHIGRVSIVGDWVGASSDSAPPPDTDVVIRLDPSRSFGTGAHQSTRLMIEAMQRSSIEGLTVFDVGCGSGVLSIAALLLGAAAAHGTDTEDAALEVTLDNARRNGVSDRCTTSRPSAIVSTRTYDLVLANILAPVLIELAPMLSAAVGSNGRLLLAGLIEEQVERVVKAFPEFSLKETLTDGNWRCLELWRL